MANIGILLTNTGTPDAPTRGALRTYLREFLSDPRIVHLPRSLWLPILYGLILPLRPQKSAQLYAKIWTENGSPMRIYMQKIRELLQEKLNFSAQKEGKSYTFFVEMGMNYGHPSIPMGLKKLQQLALDELILLPLFPQYSNTTTASSFDKIDKHLKTWSPIPNTHFISSYHQATDYINNLSKTVQQQWSLTGKSPHLLISFHGIPERFIAAGDPYQVECKRTATLLAEALQLSKDEWTLSYQSQFGYDKWLKPATHTLLSDLPARGIKEIDVICPGFSVDCLETLEEIAIRGKTIFLQAGGQSLHYIPALNAESSHIEMLATEVKRFCS